MSRDPFSVLGLPADADDDAIKAAYRRRARETHPDSPGGSENAFVSVKEAFEKLRDPGARSRLRAEHERAMRSRTPPDSMQSAFADFFAEVETNGRGREIGRRAAETRGPRQQVDLSLSLEQAFTGGTFTTRSNDGACTGCEGRGWTRHEAVEPCEMCEGFGFLRAVKGIVSIERHCTHCDGVGRTRRRICGNCGGSGGGSGGIVATVEVPEGCRDGYRTVGRDRPDVDVSVRVRAHPVFTRDIEDLGAQVRIPVWEAALGGEVWMTGVDGRDLTFSCPPGTQTGDEIVIEGGGMPAFSGRGRLVVTVDVEVPDASDGAAREAFLELKRRMVDRPG